MTKIILIIHICLLSIVATSDSLSADSPAIIVIVHESNETQRMSTRQVRKLFLGKSRKFPNGIRAVLISNESIKSDFNSAALRKADSQVEAAWARLKFSGRAKPPIEFSNAADVVRYVAENENAIGYVSSSVELTGVKIVHTVK